MFTITNVDSPTPRRFTSELTLLLIVCLGLMPGAGVFSQESTQDDDDDETFAEAITVTAQKREQNLEDVPLSISAISDTLIEDSGMVGVQELSQMTPGLVYAETIGRQTASPSIRGITPFGFADPTVQILIDGFTLGFNRSGNNATLFDLERIEVLRGPQATLYGRNAIGGVINFVTKPPSNSLAGGLSAEAGTRDSYLVQGSISGPLANDKLGASLALGYRNFGGFMDNTVTNERNVNEEEDLNARFRLSFNPTDSVAFNLTVDHNEADDRAGDPSHVPPAFFSANPPSLVDVRDGRVDFNDFDQTVSQDVLGGFDREESTFVLNTTVQLGFAELVSITGFADQSTSIITDVTRTPGPSFFGDFFDVTIDNRGFSEELRLTSTNSERVLWLIGAYYFENERDRFLSFDNGPFIQDTTGETDNAAVFVNLEVALTDDFYLSGGLRYDREDRKEINNLTNTFEEADFEEVLPNVTLSYRPEDALYHVYGTFSRGYHAGGPNSAAAVADGAPLAYDSEFVSNFEVGLKGSSADRRFTYETAAFYMDWTDQQIQTSLSTLVGFISNAGESEVKGVELAGRYSSRAGLSLSLSMSVLDTEYTEYLDALSAAPFGLDPDLSGNELVYAADFSGSFSAQYLRPLGQSQWAWRIRSDVNHVGERPFDVTNLLVADAYTVVNLYAGIENGDVEVGLFADNAFDEDYLTGGILPSLFFPPLLTVGDPSVYGVRARLRF